MRIRHLVASLFVTSFGFAVVCPVQAASKAPAAKASVVPTFVPVELPQSIFAPATNPKEGRNPFFPQSAPVAPIVKPKEGAKLDVSGLVLNGITSPPKQTAMINGRTFEPGEEGEIKLPTGAKVLIKCESIGADSTIIVINGMRRELHLRFGL